MTAAVHPRIIAPQGLIGICAVVPTATPPANVAFCICTCKTQLVSFDYFNDTENIISHIYLSVATIFQSMRFISGFA